MSVGRHIIARHLSQGSSFAGKTRQHKRERKHLSRNHARIRKCTSPRDGYNFGAGTLQQPLSLPDGLQPRPLSDAGYLTEEIAENVHFVSDGTYSIIFAVTDDGVVVVDAPPLMGDKVTQAIAEKTDKPVSHVIYSHAHFDHIGAAAALFGNGTVDFVGTPITAEEVADAADPARPAVTLVVQSGGSLKVGDQEFRLTALPNAHDRATTLIELRGTGVVVLVDMFAPGWAGFPCASALITTYCIPCWHDFILVAFMRQALRLTLLENLSHVDPEVQAQA